MRDGYRLDQLANGHWQLLSPFDEPIAEIEQKAYSIEIRPNAEKFGQNKDIPIENIEIDKDGSILEMSGFPLIEPACNPYVEAHYKITTTCPKRFRNWLEEWNPVWGWLFGAVGFIVAILSRLD